MSMWDPPVVDGGVRRGRPLPPPGAPRLPDAAPPLRPIEPSEPDPIATAPPDATPTRRRRWLFGGAALAVACVAAAAGIASSNDRPPVVDQLSPTATVAPPNEPARAATTPPAIQPLRPRAACQQGHPRTSRPTTASTANRPQHVDTFRVHVTAQSARVGRFGGDHRGHRSGR